MDKQNSKKPVSAAFHRCRLAAVIVLALAFIMIPSAAFADEGDDPYTEAFASGTWGTCPWELMMKKSSFEYDDMKLIIHPGAGTLCDGTGSYPWDAFDVREFIKIVVFESEPDGNKVKLPESTAGMFTDYENLEEVDLRGADAANVKSMAGMFNGDIKLTTLTGISDLNAPNLEDLSQMFLFCLSLKTVDVSKLITSSAKSMNSMFSSCTGLESLDFSSANTSGVRDISCLFSGCSNLKTLVLTGFDTSSATNMESMFNGCNSIEQLDLSGFRTSNVTDMNGMFRGCSSLSTLDVSGFDTAVVTNMDNMFRECGSLKSLDFTEWDSGALDHAADYMFAGSSSIVKVTVGPKLTGYFGILDMNSYEGGAPETDVEWYSVKDNKFYDAYDDIYRKRMGIADTYLKSDLPIAKATVKFPAKAYTYTGKAIKPVPTVTLGGKKLKSGTDYTVSYSKNKNVGKATAKITGKKACTGNKTASFTIKKAKNPMTVKTKPVNVKASAVSKKDKTYIKSAVFTVKKAKGKVTYKKTKGSSKIIVSNAGKITLKKGLKKGTYKVKVKVTAAGSKNYNKLTKKVTVKITVK